MVFSAGAIRVAAEGVASVSPSPAQGVTVVTNLSESTLILVAGIVMLLALVVLFVFRRFIVNSIAGILAILALSLFGVHISINLLTIAVVAVLGLVGVALLIILKLAGVTI